VLEVADIAVSYRGMPAISDVSFKVLQGQIVLLAGANGAGKSTVLKAIAGMERLRSGQILFEGNRIDGEPAYRITLRGIGYVPENRRLFPRLSVRDNLRLGSYLFRHQDDRDAPLKSVFSLFPRLQERLEQKAGTLSGGEQQMLAIGRALMSRPRLLMLDEPSQGIMPKLVDEIFDAIRAIRATGVTILLVEQRLSMSLETADHAIILQSGKIVLRGAPGIIRENPLTRQAYLGL